MSDDFDPFKDLAKLDDEEPLDNEKRDHFDPFATEQQPAAPRPHKTKQDIEAMRNMAAEDAPNSPPEQIDPSSAEPFVKPQAPANGDNADPFATPETGSPADAEATPPAPKEGSEFLASNPVPDDLGAPIEPPAGSNPIPADLGAPIERTETAPATTPETPPAGANPVPDDLGAPIEPPAGSNPIPADLGAPIEPSDPAPAPVPEAPAEPAPAATSEFSDEPLIADLPMSAAEEEKEDTSAQDAAAALQSGTQEQEAAPETEAPKAATEEAPADPAPVEETQPQSAAAQNDSTPADAALDEPDEEIEMFDDDMRNYIEKGQSVDLTELDPTLREVRIGVGWDQRAMTEQMADIDLSLFLLKNDGQTGFDEDFVFYNNPQDLNEAAKHLGDSRTGAGEGDDEQADILLTSLSYETARVTFVLSVYDDELRGYTFDLAKNIFIRVMNKENMEEIIRFRIPEEDLAGKRAMYMASIIREGPQWIFEAESRSVEGTLADIATAHGILVKELQSTGG